MRLEQITDSGPFEYRWPQLLESFESGWSGIAVDGGERFRFRHAVGEREVYGTHRVHTVTFLAGNPIVEGVAADDFGRSRALLSLIKPGAGHRLAKEPADLPEEYGEFEVVQHRDEIVAPYSKRCLALKIRVDDLDRWITHAVTRVRLRR